MAKNKISAMRELGMDNGDKAVADKAYASFCRMEEMIGGIESLGFKVRDENPLRETASDMIELMMSAMYVNPYDEDAVKEFKKVMRGAAEEYPGEKFIPGPVYGRVVELRKRIKERI